MPAEPPDLEHLRWSQRPSLDAPVLVLAFAGWSDAGDAATAAVRFLAEQWEAQPFAAIDPEPFFDFTSTRPLIRFDDDGRREILWPENELAASSFPRAPIEVVTLAGNEPQLRWRTFAEQIVGLARSVGASRAITLGALLADVPHARPVSVFGVGDGPGGLPQLGLQPSRYEGPTGITGVLEIALRDAGIPSASLWAAVPTYVPAAPSPKAALALVERATELLGVPVDTTELVEAAREYEQEVSDLVERDVETAEYVRELEASYDEDEPELFVDSSSFVEDVERFLRDQG